MVAIVLYTVKCSNKSYFKNNASLFVNENYFTVTPFATEFNHAKQFFSQQNSLKHQTHLLCNNFLCISSLLPHNHCLRHRPINNNPLFICQHAGKNPPYYLIQDDGRVWPFESVLRMFNIRKHIWIAFFITAMQYLALSSRRAIVKDLFRVFWVGCWFCKAQEMTLIWPQAPITI